MKHILNVLKNEIFKHHNTISDLVKKVTVSQESYLNDRSNEAQFNNWSNTVKDLQSQIKYCADRVKWVWDNRRLIGGLRWTYEPNVLRFFFGRMKEIGYWQEELTAKFKEDFGDSL